MNECTKALQRRLQDSRFVRRYFRGRGLDIGAGNDGLSQYCEYFPFIESVRDWDLKDGDAQYLRGVPDNSYDFVHSTHCLEHMQHPGIALENWLRVLKPSGHLICMVPDEDLYEQGIFPSQNNTDHKFTFTIQKAVSWCNRSISLTKLLTLHGKGSRVLKLELLDSTFSFRGPIRDQTLGPLVESAIEFVLRKESDPLASV